MIRNSDGLPLPTTFLGRPATAYLIDAAEQDRRQSEMTKVCESCHGISWVSNFLARVSRTNAEADSMVVAATTVMLKAWQVKLADNKNPFDESLELKWVEQWLFYANSVRYASAMAGPDYATFQHGWWDLTRNLEEMREYLARHSDKRK